jgi:hypothetical protein
LYTVSGCEFKNFHLWRLQSLSEDFRVNYAHLWLSIIDADLDGTS